MFIEFKKLTITGDSIIIDNYMVLSSDFYKV